MQGLHFDEVNYDEVSFRGYIPQLHGRKDDNAAQQSSKDWAVGGEKLSPVKEHPSTSYKESQKSSNRKKKTLSRRSRTNTAEDIESYPSGDADDVDERRSTRSHHSRHHHLSHKGSHSSPPKPTVFLPATVFGNMPTTVALGDHLPVGLTIFTGQSHHNHQPEVVTKVDNFIRREAGDDISHKSSNMQQVSPNKPFIPTQAMFIPSTTAAAVGTDNRSGLYENKHYPSMVIPSNHPKPSS